jgi:hypothetical protein
MVTFQVSEPRFRLRQPKRHLHILVQVNRGTQLRSRLFAIRELAVYLAKGTVAVGLEGTHPEFIGQGEGLFVVGLSLLECWGIALRGNLSE